MKAWKTWLAIFLFLAEQLLCPQRGVWTVRIIHAEEITSKHSNSSLCMQPITARARWRFKHQTPRMRYLLMVMDIFRWGMSLNHLQWEASLNCSTDCTLTLLFDVKCRIESGDSRSNFKTTSSLLSGLTHALSNRQVPHSPAFYGVRPAFSHRLLEHVFSNSTPQDILILVKRDATQSSLFIILQVHSTCFGCEPHQSSGIHKTVTTASGTGHIFCVVTPFQHGQALPRWREVAAEYRRL